MTTTKDTDIAYVRITVTMPKDVAQHIYEMPSQNRSKEISQILDEEFKRRAFLENLNKFKKSKFALPKKFKLTKTPIRKIYEVFN